MTEKSQEEHCTSYQFVPFVGIKVAQILDKAGGIITALATIAIAIFTFTLKRATDKLWDAGERQLRLLSETSTAQSRDMEASIRVAADAASAAFKSNQIAVYNAEQQLRAYVFVQNITLEMSRHAAVPGAYINIPGAVHTYRFNIVWENSGQTPARNMLFNFNFRSFPDRMSDDFDFADSEPPQHDVIGPRAVLTLPGIDLPATEIESGIGKNLRWYIWAWVEYDDIFEGTPRHRTEYCCEVRVRRHPITNEIGIGFPIHGKFNGADGEGLLAYDGHNNKYG